MNESLGKINELKFIDIEKKRRVKKWKKGKSQPPVTLEINPINQCNLNCLTCWQRGVDKSKLGIKLPQNKLLKLIKEAESLGVMEIKILSAREPLKRKETVIKMMKLIKELNMLGFLNTNGTLLDYTTCKMIVNMEWDNITISIDGLDASTHDRLRGVKGAFTKAIKSIDWIKSIKKEDGKKYPKEV